MPTPSVPAEGRTPQPPPPRIEPHALSTGQVVAALGSDAERGLSTAEAALRLARHGPNALREAPGPARWRRLLAQFDNLVTALLIAAALVSAALREWPEAIAILAIVALNAAIGYLQEQKAESAIASLRTLTAPTARAVRDGVAAVIPARDLVPGDLIQLEAGDHVPADARLLTGFAFRTQEAALTGESAPVSKRPGQTVEAMAALGERANMVYMGTQASAGAAAAVVTATGMGTELGRIAGLLASVPAEPTPLQKRFSDLGRILVILCLAIVSLIFLLQVQRGGDLLEVFLVAVSLAVAAVPEGLTAVVTVTLALGLQRLARRNALVRRLSSVETLGSVTTICSDKTGTLTRNEMTVRVVIAGDIRYAVGGTGYAPRGRIRRDGAGAVLATESEDGPPVSPDVDRDLMRALEVAAVCNHASVSAGPGETWRLVGDPTEGALLVAALKVGIEPSVPGRRVIEEIPFDPERRAMSVVTRDAAGATVIHTKGAPEAVLAMCDRELRGGVEAPLVDARREEILRESASLAENALRVLALAYRSEPESEDGVFAERGLVLAGLAGMIDPPREEAKDAVRRCRAAGIRPVMITGDHPATARAIARELDIASDGVLAGPDVEKLSEEELGEAAGRVCVYARASAEHKLRLVQALKGRGEVVAMTGDGVNDAPAVRTADIGIAMGLTGTDVTKEAADLVLADDNFASIVNAVGQGRAIYDNILKFVHYLLACNASEVLVMFGASLAGWPAPLVPTQILWINLVTDGPPALALAMEPPEPDLMRRRPRPAREAVIGWAHAGRLFVHGILLALATAAAFALTWRGRPESLEAARVTAFCVLALSQVAYVFACRSPRRTMPQIGLFTNPHLLGGVAVAMALLLGAVLIPAAAPIFRTGAAGQAPWALIAGLSLAPVTIIEGVKLLKGMARTGRPDRGPS